jgi:hypothetical protein
MPTNEDRIAALENELAKLRGEEEAKPPSKPWEPLNIDWTARMGMPPSAIEAMARAPGMPSAADLMSDAWAHAQMFCGAPADSKVRVVGAVETKTAEAPQRGSGWQEPAKLTSPPGIGLIDRMVEMQTLREKRDALLVENERLRALKRLRDAEGK